MTESNGAEYELSEIEWILVEKPKFIFSSGKSKFVARITGKDGSMIAGESPVFLGSDPKGTPPNSPFEGRNSWEDAHNVLDTLTDMLTKEGWEYVDTQKIWFQKRFRRRIAGAVFEKADVQPGIEDVISQLERLNALHKDGGLSDEEFLVAKKKLLGN